MGFLLWFFDQSRIVQFKRPAQHFAIEAYFAVFVFGNRNMLVNIPTDFAQIRQ